MTGKRIVLPVTNKELREELESGTPAIALAEKYGCASSVIERRLVEKNRYEKVDLNEVTGYEIINLTEAMKITGLSRFLITKMVKDGALNFKKVGNRYMFQLRDVYKIVGIELGVADGNELTEMDMLKENQQKSVDVEHVVNDLLREVQTLKKSVGNTTKEAYDENVLNALKVINDSQRKMNDTILEMKKDQMHIKDELTDINTEIDKLNTANKMVKRGGPVHKKDNPLAKFGGG